jgi:tetratricopeptide (TPR) repeat protein
LSAAFERTVPHAVFVAAIALGSGCRPTAAPRIAKPVVTPTAVVLPEDRIAAIVAAFQAAMADRAAKRDCAAWTDELREIHRAHGDRYVDALLYAGHVWRWCGEPDKAYAVFERVIKAEPRWARAQAWVAIAVLEQENGRAAQAESALRNAVDADSGLDVAWLDLARLLVGRYGRTHDAALYEETRELVMRHVERSVGDPRWKLVLARLHLAHADVVKDAAREADLIVSIVIGASEDDRVRSEAFLLKGRLFALGGDQVDALRAYRKAVELDADNAEAWASAALIHIDFRDFRSGLESIAHAQRDRRFRGDRQLERARGSAFAALRQYERAARVYERLAREDPSDFANQYDLATLAEQRSAGEQDLLMREALLSEAAQHYRAFLREAPAEQAEARERAAAFLLRYAAPPPPPVSEPPPRTGRRDRIE